MKSMFYSRENLERSLKSITPGVYSLEIITYNAVGKTTTTTRSASPIYKSDNNEISTLPSDNSESIKYSIAKYIEYFEKMIQKEHKDGPKTLNIFLVAKTINEFRATKVSLFSDSDSNAISDELDSGIDGWIDASPSAIYKVSHNVRKNKREPIYFIKNNNTYTQIIPKSTGAWEFNLIKFSKLCAIIKIQFGGCFSFSKLKL